MKCPVCKTVDLLMSERQGVEIDYCPECRGVWLDRGELDKIIERTAPEASEPPPREVRGEYDRRPDHEHGHSHEREHDRYHHEVKYDKHYKKKSLLKELFDF